MPEKGSLSWSNRLNRQNILNSQDEVYIPAEAPLLDAEVKAQKAARTAGLVTAKTGKEPIAVGNVPDDIEEESSALLDENFWDENIRHLPSGDEAGRSPTVLSAVNLLDDHEITPWDENEGVIKPDHLLKDQTISLDQD